MVWRYAGREDRMKEAVVVVVVMTEMSSRDGERPADEIGYGCMVRASRN